MRRLIVPVLAMLLCAPGAHAKGRGCLVLTDSYHDVRVAVAGVAATPDDNEQVSDRFGHLDVYWTTVEVTGGDLVVRPYIWGAKALKAEGRNGTWTVSFTIRGQRAVFTATSAGSAGALSQVTYRAGLEGRELVQVTGSVGDYAMEMKAPLAVFGNAAPRPRDVLSDFQAESYEHLAGTSVSARDFPEGGWRGTYVVPSGGARRCSS